MARIALESKQRRHPDGVAVTERCSPDSPIIGTDVPPIADQGFGRYTRPS